MTRRRWWLLAVAVAALALAASANSMANGYAYDDFGIIVNSPRVHSLGGWVSEFAQRYWPEGDGYRPLAIIAFKIQWAVGSGAPVVFHAVNVALHVATAVAVFWLAGALLPLAAAWTASALYAVHPVHVEAIANVVGQSELVVALLVVVAVGLYVRGRLRGSLTPRRWCGIGALYAIACLFKEHAIVAPALLVLAEATVMPNDAPLRRRLAAIRVPLLALALIALVYLWARSLVMLDGFSGFRQFIVFAALRLSATDRILTMIGAAPEWLRLFLWPARLMSQYSPPYIEVAHGPSLSQLPGLLVLLGTIGLLIACWRRSPATSFGIGWLMVTLLPASNFIVPAGFIIAERTLLLPSVGAMIAVGSVVPWLQRKVGEMRAARVAAAGVLVVLIGLGIARSYTRNRVWRDDESLVRQGVLDSPDGYMAHFQAGVYYISHDRSREGEMHYRRAIQLFPYDPLMVYAFAEQLRVAGKCDAAIPLYQWVFSAWPDQNSRRGHLGYALCLLSKRRFDEAREEALTWIRRGGRLSFGREVLAAAKAKRQSVGTPSGAIRP